MDHIAIMKKSWKLLPLIISGKKICEARWYKNPNDPWNKAKKGDTIYFKNSGDPITLSATVTKVHQYKVNSQDEAEKIMRLHALADLGEMLLPPEIMDYISGKNYATFIYFYKVKKVNPFNINKAGYGSMTAWISIDNVDKITNISK